MNVDTGELRKLMCDDNIDSPEARIAELQRQMEELRKESAGWEAVPSELEEAAKKKLAGKDSAMVSLTSGGKLSKWAAQERKKKHKRAANSRRKNRK